MLLSFIFLLPDFIFMVINHNYFYWHLSVIKELAALLLISFLILGIEKFWLRYAFAIFITTLSFAQLFHFSYFHSYIMPYEVGLIDQVAEILDTLSDVIGYTYIPLIVFIVQLVILYFFLKKTQTVRIPYGWAILSLLLLMGPISAHKRTRAYVYLPKSTSFSFKNTYVALSWYLGKELFAHHKKHHFKPYKIVEHNVTIPKNIIFIMGESLTAKKMSLFGYPKETTPHLEEWAKSGRLLYTWGVSAGVTTDVSVPTFFTLKREPQNTDPLITNSTNLIRLAHQKGYITHYITTQTLFIIGGLLGDFTDHKKVYKGYDQLLVEYLDQVDFNKSNFIVLHQRNSHSPYEKYTPPQFYKYSFRGKPYHEYILNSYLDSILYTDYIYNEIFKKADNLKECTVVFATSDHGEMTGEKDEGGKYGHVYLGFEDTIVPLLVYYNKACPVSVTKELNLSHIINHYTFGKMVAKVMGYKIINPNENGEYYVNGVDIAGNKGFLRYKSKYEAWKGNK